MPNIIRIVIQEKLDENDRPIAGERRAIAAYTSQNLLNRYINDAGLNKDSLKFDFYEPEKDSNYIAPKNTDICYVLYKKWSIHGPYEISGYSFSQSFQDAKGGLDEFVMPILLNSTYDEIEAWKKSALKAAASALTTPPFALTNKKDKTKTKTKARRSGIDREKQEAAALLSFAQRAYQAVKPKSLRERTELKIIGVFAIVWIISMFFIIPSRPKLVDNAASVNWLPGVTDVSYYYTTELLIFEGHTTLKQALEIGPVKLKPVATSSIARYTMFKPETNKANPEALEKDPKAFERWQQQFQVRADKCYIAKLPDGSRLLYDSKNQTLYGYIQGNTLKNWKDL